MQNMTPMTEEQYAEHWSLESDKHQRFSDYNWMAKLLNGSTFILEIGCGNGTSTKHLLQKDCKVIIIEANYTLANIACQNLNSFGYTGKIAKDNNDIDATLQFNILVESVFSETARDIVKSHRFDYIINWLFGASPYTIANEEGVDINQVSFQAIPAYREKSASRALELKECCINPDCKFHYVLRASYDTSAVDNMDNLKTAFAEEQSEQLGLKEGDLISIEIRKSESLSRKTASSMKYIHTSPGATLPSNIKAVLVSVII